MRLPKSNFKCQNYRIVIILLPVQLRDPWFACILNEAYYELRLYKPEEARKYMESFNKNATAAYLNRDPVTKLFPYQATKKFTWEQNASWVIHQVGVAEQAVLCALYSIE